MKTKITIICENKVSMPSPLIGEHGLSFLIENGDTTLFDTGQGLGIVNNMRVMGKNFGAVQRVILSHGHYDHTGGLLAVLQNRGGQTPVFLHPDAFNDKRALIPTGSDPIDIPIGMRASREEYEKAGAVFHHVNGFQKITEKISALSEVKRSPEWKFWDDRLKQKVNNEISEDPFHDDLSIVIETESGPVVLLGCAHAGIVDILYDISERIGNREIHAVIGGTHLESAPEVYIERAISALKWCRVKTIATSHCTGFNIACRFASEFPGKFANASVGSVFEF
jgi:7,8-dihydropterin-6-yl-methyl-4-(beta-D-ribofuranosyl)aminobenzene 5'-phosphate synthase